MRKCFPIGHTFFTFRLSPESYNTLGNKEFQVLARDLKYLRVQYFKNDQTRGVRMFKRIFNGGNKKRHNGPRELLSIDQFRVLVLHECARCDRNFHQFSLIEMDLPPRGRKKPTGDQIRKIMKRIRETDEAGWLSDKSLGIFLPETDRKGATILAKALCEESGFQIYTYPDLISFDKGKNNRRERNFSDQGSGRAESPDGTVSNGSDNEHCCDSLPSARVAITQDVEAMVFPGRISAWKRAIDIVGASLALAILSPLFAILSAYIKVVSKGSVLFKQERIGYLGHPFTIYKFRTMKTGSDSDIHKNHLKNLINSDCVLTKLDDDKDVRLIPLAGLIRKTCLDELPQLFNVLKGEMSLVGPRPLLSYEAEEFTIWQRQRMHTLPGMTGLWQVSGKNRLTFSQMMRLDARYCRKAGFVLDSIIFMKTVPAIMGQILDSIRGKMTCSGPEKGKDKLAIWNRNIGDLVRQFFL